MSEKHEIIFQTDGRHSSVYLYEPPMGVRQYVEPIDEVVDLGIDTISYVVGDCSLLLYDTKVGERWGHNVDLADHEVWYRAGRNCQAMIDSGHDPLMVVCRHAQQRGFTFLPHLILNMHHTAHGRVTNCRVSDFTTEHPEWQVGEEPNYPEAEFDSPNRLSFAVPEVRQDRLAVIHELVADYPTDGIELNFREYAPFIGRGEVEEHTDTLTEWMRQIRKVCDEAAEAQGRAKRLVARVSATVAGNKLIGHDIESWLKEGIVDTLIAMPVGGDFASETARLREMVELAQGSGIPVLAGFDSVGAEQTAEVHRAAVANAYAAGAQGIHYQRYYPPPHRYPYTTQDTDRLRYLAYPDIVAHKDKTFHVGPGGDRPKAITYGLTEQLPRVLKVGAPPEEVSVDVADDIAAKEAVGELWRCELRVMLHEMLHDDEARLYWNGVEVPQERIRMADWVFQMRPGGGVRGYRFHVDLKDGMLPRPGANVLRVELLKKDEKLIHPISIHDVDILVEYLPHRNALRHDETYDGAAVTFMP